MQNCVKSCRSNRRHMACGAMSFCFLSLQPHLTCGLVASPQALVHPWHGAADCSCSATVLHIGQKGKRDSREKAAQNSGYFCLAFRKKKKKEKSQGFFLLFCCVQGFHENRHRSNLLFSLRESKGALIFSLPIPEWIIIVRLPWVTTCAVQCPDLHLNETKWLYIQKWYTVMMMVIKAKSSFILDWLLLGIAVIWGLCR